jgi:hypothetical protein
MGSSRKSCQCEDGLIVCDGLTRPPHDTVPGDLFHPAFHAKKAGPMALPEWMSRVMGRAVSLLPGFGRFRCLGGLDRFRRLCCLARFRCLGLSSLC